MNLGGLGGTDDKLLASGDARRGRGDPRTRSAKQVRRLIDFAPKSTFAVVLASREHSTIGKQDRGGVVHPAVHLRRKELPGLGCRIEQLRRVDWIAIAIHLAAGEIMLRRPGFAGVHPVTSANALHYAFRMSSRTETRLLLILQGIGWMCHFVHRTADASRHQGIGRDKITEMSGRDSDNKKLSEFDLFYETRQKESWEQTAAWETSQKNLLPTNSIALQGISYRQNFIERLAGTNLEKFTHDYAYGGDGQIVGQVSRWISDPEVLVDARSNEMNIFMTSNSSKRNYREYTIGNPTLQFESNFEIVTNFLNGNYL